MHYKKIKQNIYDCKVCPTRCDGVSLANYNFENDVVFSEKIENKIISIINNKFQDLIAFKTNKVGYPDIEIVSKKVPEKTIKYIEIKVQARTFMSISTVLPQSGLTPSETVALNLSDLERYFSIKDKEQLPLYIVWCVMHRPCIVTNQTQIKVFHQEISILRQIRERDIDNHRRFRRKSGEGDIVDGQHKGVVVNYHFSLNELKPGLPNLSV